MPENDLALLTDAALAAGDIAVKFWRNSPRTWYKAGHQGPVTEADIAIDSMLRARLMAARPDYGWLSEETADTAARLSNRSSFVIDPIDGTRAFIEGDRTFAHSLAVVRDGAVTAAVVFLPLRDKLYAAQQGMGATLNDAPIRVTDRAALDGADLLIARAALEPQHWSGPVPQVQRHLRPSLAYRLCLVAEGRFDATLTLRDSWHWDTAAGSLIVTESGGMLTDRHGAQMPFNTPSPLSRGVVAAGPSLHALVIKRLA